jgi:hypothetical protein
LVLVFLTSFSRHLTDLGHSSPRATGDFYAQGLMEGEAVKKMNKLFLV